MDTIADNCSPLSDEMLRATEPLTVLFVGALEEGSTTHQRMRAFRDLRHSVTPVSVTDPAAVQWPKNLWHRIRHRMGRPVDRAGANARLQAAAMERCFDLVWIDKSLVIKPETLEIVRREQPGALIVGYSPDDMAARHNQSKYFLRNLKLFDVFFTTKSYNVAELRQLGCRRVEFVANAYDPHTHRPLELSAEQRRRLGGPVGFVGTFEQARAESMLRLAEAGIPVRIYGSGWRRMAGKHPRLIVSGPGRYGDEYARLICAFDINLCFLRKMNRDLQTQRSVEIPACRAFMLAERTQQHQQLFAEGEEAEYFSDDRELLEKVRHYLDCPGKRRSVAQAGYRRCLESGYSYHHRIHWMLSRHDCLTKKRRTAA